MFWIKTALIAVAGINMVIFEFITVRDVQKWNVDKTPPQQAHGRDINYLLGLGRRLRSLDRFHPADGVMRPIEETARVALARGPGSVCTDEKEVAMTPLRAPTWSPE